MNYRLLLSAALAALLIAGCARNESSNDEHAEAEEGEEGHEEGEHAPASSTRIEAAVAEETGIKTQAVGAGAIRDEHEVQGLLTPVEGRHARVVARFPGPVKAVHVAVGDQVRAGQPLAVIESNVSLSN